MPYIIGISGPSCSGKSTIAKFLQEKHGFTRLKLDTFFKDVKDMPKFGKWPNWELPESLKLNELFDALSLLRQGETVEIPVFKKVECKQVGETMVKPSRVMVLEGFHALYDPQIRNLINLSVFIDVSNDEQWKRRQERHPACEKAYFDKVIVPAYEQYGMPTKEHAKYVIDGNRSKEDVLKDFLDIMKKEEIL